MYYESKIFNKIGISKNYRDAAVEKWKMRISVLQAFQAVES